MIRDGNLVSIKIKVMKNGEEIELSINKVIPSLKNLESKELEREFGKLYDIVVIQYSKNYEIHEEEGNIRYWFWC